MNRRRCDWLLAAVLLGLPLAASAQSEPLYFLNWPAVEVVESDEGVVEVDVPWALEGTPQREVRFHVSTFQDDGTLTYDDVADPGIDFEPVARTLVVIPAHQRSGTVRVRVRGDHEVEPTQRFFVHFTDIVGARTIEGTDHSRGGVDIVDDDVAPVKPAVIVRDDRIVAGRHFHGAPEYGLYVLANDTTPGDRPVDLSVVQAPAHGTATVRNPDDTIERAVIVYSPEPGFVGTDRLRYRYCSPSGGCGEAWADIEILAFAPVGQPISLRRGHHDVMLIAPVAMPSARFEASPLARSVPRVWRTGTDTTPHSPWDNEEGRVWELVPLPPLADGEQAEWRLAIEVATTVRSYRNVDVFIGVDRNGDGRPSADEVLCVGGDREPDCEAAFRQESGVVAYWTMLHSREPQRIDHAVRRWQVAVTPVAGDGSLVATGPGHVLKGHYISLGLAYVDDSMVDDDRRFGVVRIHADDGTVLTDLPVWLNFNRSGHTPTLLVPGEPHTFTLDVDEEAGATFFDVPAGATRLVLEAEAGVAMDFRLVRATGTDDPDDPRPGEAPDGAVASASSSAGGTTLVVDGAALQPGRWFVATRNRSGRVGQATVQVEIEGQAPPIRPGSYFDSERPGSGLFLYPAGDQWAGLWYTYGRDERGTWYYLQAPAPGTDGIWRSAIFRAAWNGGSRTLTEVGVATVTPTGVDAFQFSYTLDGAVGTRPQASLGRGCPVSGSTPVDISSHWFDPAKDGTGYSLQVWPDYEYFAAFVYDRQGIPTFLAAEFTGFGGAEASAPLQVLTGACPTCDTHHFSNRYEAGTLSRRIVAGSLAAVSMDALWEYDGDVPSVWSTVDAVQLLGGPGSTQGCMP